ncbi:hypothetical protein BA3_0023 [Thalassomonas phage BA3]|uniref:hypothetical protein n=1 Tax=Thalassomonas phage BA3 TaxID=469660 RepID=UPI00015D959C|nr:hypothetical protein BA3_0023 [Thalassomonas phage BA3]ABV74308.1 hypothetical protein BA3_0023 [Thalassomonas phage BA3]
MEWSDLGKKVAEFAPLLGSVVGGPAGGAIGSVIASAFGVEDKPEAIIQAVKSDPEAAIKLRKIEMDNKAELERIKMEEAKAVIADKQNARANHKHSNMPAILSGVLSLVIVGIIYLLFYTPVPEESKDVLFVILGAVMKEWGGAMQYWFGTTRNSANKDLR